MVCRVDAPLSVQGKDGARTSASFSPVFENGKALAKKGQLGAARIMAKDLIRTRHAISKFHQMKGALLCAVQCACVL